MTSRIAVSFGTVAGSQAGFGRIGARGLVADRPEGVAGGSGLGFNGAELLASALGGCFWNDLHHAAHAAETTVVVERVEAAVELAGNPPRVVRAHVSAWLSGAPPETLDRIFLAARDSTTVANSLLAAFPIHFDHPSGAPA